MRASDVFTIARKLDEHLYPGRAQRASYSPFWMEFHAAEVEAFERAKLRYQRWDAARGQLVVQNGEIMQDGEYVTEIACWIAARVLETPGFVVESEGAQ